MRGRLTGASGDIGVSEVASLWYLTPQLLPAQVHPGGMEVTESFRPKVDTGQYSYGTHAAIVALDPEFGRVEILDYVIVEDCGTMVNPMIVEGQTYGGLAQGIGTALLEEVAYDEGGQPLSSTLADYLLPGAADMPNVKMAHIETPSPNTEFGIKGVGEGGAIPPPAAIFNAVNDALRPLGVEVSQTPLSARRLLTAMRARRLPAAID
jgi:carbon-monoxide dehydrogenase large subunit